jgi:predicted dehydrogenase
MNPVMPQLFHRLSVKGARIDLREKFSKRSTYSYQLEAFCKAVVDGGPILTPPSDSINNMRVIDAIYRSAGLLPREGLALH